MRTWFRLMTEPMPAEPTWAQGTVVVLSAMGFLFGLMAVGCIVTGTR